MRPAAFLLPLLVLIAPVFAEEPVKRAITTTGTATVYVVPDEATLRFSVHTFDKELPKSKQLNDTAANETLAFLKSLAIDAKDIQSTAVASEAVYEYRQEHNRQIRGPILGYDVTRQYGVKLRDLTKLGPIYDKLLPDTRVTLGGTTLATSESRKHRDNARLQATTAAKEKAEALAGALGMAVGLPSAISENASVATPFYGRVQQNVYSNSNSFDGDAASLGDISPVGQIEVRAEVTVTFDLVPKTGEP